MEYLIDGLEDNKPKWVDIVEKDIYESRKIYLNEPISSYTFDAIVPFIEHINIKDDNADIDPSKRKPIELIINSAGGSVNDGIAIITAILRSKTPIYGFVYSYAYSMALAIALACDKLYMSEYGSLMYHEVSTGVDGNNSQIKRTQKELDRIQKIYDNLIISNSKITQEMLDEQKEKIADWIIDYEEALRLELIDGKVEDMD